MTPRPRKPYIASVPPVVMAECRAILARQLAGGVGQGGVGKRGRPTLASQRAAIRDGNAAPAMARRLARTNDGENGGASVA